MSRRSTISPGGSGGSSGASSSLPVTQANSFAVGDAVYFDGTNWAKARADAAATLGVAVVSAASASSFTAQFSGPITGLSGLTAGQYYFVSDATPGALTATEPTATTSYSNPVLLATSATAGIVLPFRPNAVQGGIWPGTVGQLTSGSGTAVSVGSGLSLSGGTLAAPGVLLGVSNVFAAETTSSTTYADVATVGPSATVIVPANGKLVVSVTSGMVAPNKTEFWVGFASVQLTGANTQSASDTYSAGATTLGADVGFVATYMFVLTGLTAGSTTVTMKYRSTGGGAWTFFRRSLAIYSAP